MAEKFINKGVAVGSASTDLYTCPASTSAVIHALYISNVDGVNPSTVTIEVYDLSEASTFKVGYKLPIPAQSTLILDKPVNLETGDILKLTANVAGDVEAFASILEIT